MFGALKRTSHRARPRAGEVLGFASRPRDRRAASSLRRRCANGSAPSARAGAAGPASPATAAGRGRGASSSAPSAPRAARSTPSGAPWLRPGVPPEL